MARSRAAARDAGTWLETATATYLAEQLADDRIERRAKNGAKDRGDIGGVRHMGGRLVIECKNHTGTPQLPAWTREAQIEAGNDDALCGVVVHKRHGSRDPGAQWVSMTLADLVALLTGTPTAR